MDEPMPDARPTMELRVTADELELIRNALRSLESIMGREEADTLEQIQGLLAKLGG